MAAARSRLLVQAMTFEADVAGRAVAQAVADSGAPDRRVLVDSYSRLNVNDSAVFSPRLLRDGAFRREVRDTRAMFRDLARRGAGVRATNPVGLNPLRYAVRNHKKLIVADDVAYVGGINFSDHNFAWDDLMLRIESAAAADFLAADFDATWAGRGVFSQARLGDLSLYALDGRSNAAGFADLLAALAQAKASVTVVSPYLTFPFVEPLAAAVRRGVGVELLTPLENNKPLVRDYLLHAALEAGITVRLTPGMSHLKAMLIDGRRLALGSSNFDFVSWHVEEELLAIVDDPALVASFCAQVLEPQRAAAIRGEAHRPTAARAARARATLRLAERVVRLVRNTRRTAVEWT